MALLREIDTTFDFRSDTPPGADPDVRSPMLRRYHKLLWSKRLPNGVFFELVASATYDQLRVAVSHRRSRAKFRGQLGQRSISLGDRNGSGREVHPERGRPVFQIGALRAMPIT